ncbi:hypothetical protein [Glaciimonas immobilis]|uniref:Uncharacterized protein n=1 Tax=Glaciimonas immobilis TaxID=728004 RepID=A0A840RWA7_9BURK|nr:hypothetical protein [Glaciimonas immobilis]KAF3996329.1 hypothetical protein HAV38_19130 [Glaciimonas immobilis]MBB5202165.1 hypothetical protein [Glaciimonas immobilis]
MKVIKPLAIVLTLGWAAASVAQAPASSQAAASPNTQVNVQSGPAAVTVRPRDKDGYIFACGGVGADESAYIKSAAKNYDMMLTFARKDGSFLADIQISIVDLGNKDILHTNCGGPMMLIKFPHLGSYRISATVGDIKLTKTVHMFAKGGNRSFVFEWPNM